MWRRLRSLLDLTSLCFSENIPTGPVVFVFKLLPSKKRNDVIKDVIDVFYIKKDILVYSLEANI